MAGRRVEVWGLAGDPAQETLDILPRAQVVEVRVARRQIVVRHLRMNGAVADGVHGNGLTAAFTLRDGVMVLHALAQQTAAKRTGGWLRLVRTCLLECAQQLFSLDSALHRCRLDASHLRRDTECRAGSGDASK